MFWLILASPARGCCSQNRGFRAAAIIPRTAEFNPEQTAGNVSDNVVFRFPEEADEGQEVGGGSDPGSFLCVLIVRVLIRSILSFIYLFIFNLPFDDAGVPFEPLAAMFYVARQPGSADSA